MIHDKQESDKVQERKRPWWTDSAVCHYIFPLDWGKGKEPSFWSILAVAQNVTILGIEKIPHTTIKINEHHICAEIEYIQINILIIAILTHLK